MTRWLVLGVVVVALSVAAVVVVPMLPREVSSEGERIDVFPGSSVKKGPPGRLVLDQATSFDFGLMAQKTKGEHVWILKNEGEGEVELIKGPSSCSCTIANFSDSQDSFILKPKADTKIRLEWNTREFDGSYTKDATIYVRNDPERKELKLAIAGKVQPAMKVMPDNRLIDFGQVPNDQSKKERAALGSADRPDFKIKSLRTSRPELLKATFRPMPDEDRSSFEAIKGGYRIDVELLPTSDLGVFSEEVIVETDHPLVPEVRLVAAGKRTGAVSVFPEVVTMRNVQGIKGGESAVMILVRNASESTKFEVAEKPENLKVTLVSADDKAGTSVKVRQLKMTVTVPPGTPPGITDGKIVLKSDHPQASRITIPVDVTVVGAD